MSAALVLHFGLALGLALLALALGRSGRRSELAHLAWVLVFVKLLVPPFVEVPVLAPEPATPEAALALAPVEASLSVDIDPASLALPELDAPAPAEAPVDARTILLATWISGALLCAALLARSIRRFRRLLAEARPPSAAVEVQARAAAAALGLATPPRIRVSPARLSPALWPSRPPTLVLPQGLVEALTPGELRHVLLHEMAHLARKDHWVRVLEALAQLAYWWLPPVAWMRARLRAAEESCCDARVLRAGGDGSVYANALIRTVEFLQGSSDRLPTLATGAFGGSSLARRLTMIVLDRPQRPTRPAWRALFALALLALLPLLPARASVAAPAALPYVAPEALVPRATTQGDEPTPSAAERRLLADVLARLEAGDREGARAALEEARGPQASALVDFTAGNLAFEEERLEEAHRAYRVAVEKHPGFVRAWRNLALVQLRIGANADAAEALRRTIELGGGDARTYGLLGNCLLQANDPKGAEPAFWMATVLDPETRDWRSGLLTSLLQQRRHAEAVSLSSDLVAKHPEDARLRLVRAQALVALGQSEQAAEDLAQLEASGQATSESRLLRAELELSAGRSAAAVEGYRAALAADPAAQDRVLRAARVLMARGEREHAEALLALVVDVQPPPEPRILLALSSRGQVVYAGREIGVTGVRPLVTKLTEARALPVVVQVDETAPAGLVVRVVDEVKLAGVRDVRIATGPAAPPLPPVEADEEAQRAGPSLVAPRALHRVEPEVGPELRAHLPAIVWLAFVVDEEGEVSSPQVLRSTDARFDAAALEAVAQWRFAPGTRDGRPLLMEHRVAIPFVGDSPGELPPRLDGEVEPLDLPELDRSLRVESVASPPALVLALTADGKVIHGGREVGVEGVRALVERLLADGDRPVVLKVDGGADPKLWSRVETEAKRGGATSVEVELVLAFALSELDAKPRVLHQPAPKRSAELRERAPATVTVRFVVDERGRVHDPVVDTSTDEAFDAAALEAVKAWRFEPGLRDGQPVWFRMRAPISFPAEEG